MQPCSFERVNRNLSLVDMTSVPLTRHLFSCTPFLSFSKIKVCKYLLYVSVFSKRQNSSSHTWSYQFNSDNYHNLAHTFHCLCRDQERMIHRTHTIMSMM